MKERILILTYDSNMILSGNHAIHFPYTLMLEFKKLNINAYMTGLEDAAYLNTYDIKFSILQAKMLYNFRKILNVKVFKKININLYILGIKKILKKYNPDFVLAINIFPIKEIFKEIKKYSKLIFWSVDDPRFFNEEWFEGASEANYVLTQSYGSIIDYKERGINNVDFLPLAFDPRFFNKLNLKKDIDILFVGTIKGRKTGYENILKPSIEKFGKKVTLVGWGLNKKELKKANILPPVSWNELTFLFNRAKIVINIHVDKNKEKEGTFNYRDFETPGSGAFIVSDHVKKMELCFEPKKELIMINDTKETIEILEYYLKEKEERDKIALKGYKRAKKDHTVNNRVKFLIKLFNKI